MNNDIKAGDLVMVVRADVCGCTTFIGNVFTVQIIRPARDDRAMFCEDCGNETPWVAMAGFSESNGTYEGVAISALKKMDPPALQDETEKELELAL